VLVVCPALAYGFGETYAGLVEAGVASQLLQEVRLVGHVLELHNALHEETAELPVQVALGQLG